MNFYLNLALTYIVVGMFFSFLFYQFFKRRHLKRYLPCLLAGILGAFFGGFLDVFIVFDPLKYLAFFRRVFTIGVFWPAVSSVIVLIFYSKAVENN